MTVTIGNWTMTLPAHGIENLGFVGELVSPRVFFSVRDRSWGRSDDTARLRSRCWRRERVRSGEGCGTIRYGWCLGPLSLARTACR